LWYSLASCDRFVNRPNPHDSGISPHLALRRTATSRVRIKSYDFLDPASVSALLLLASAAAQQPPLIDRELFFGDPEISGAQISPDGNQAQNQFSGHMAPQ
jgi:hypothetical protein